MNTISVHIPAIDTIQVHSINVCPVQNDPIIEFMFDIVEGLPPARQKRLILRARDPVVRLISDVQAGLLIDYLGLSGA